MRPGLRLIANRTARTGNMPAGRPERDVDIMTGMVDAPNVTTLGKLDGEMGQHDLNVREKGEGRTGAVAAPRASRRVQASRK